MPFDKFGIYLNPGHLIHLDEWMSSPFYPGSQIPVASGMAIQVDVIPASTKYFSTRMEDGIVIADGDLRAKLKESAPDCYDRCQKRRSFMKRCPRHRFAGRSFAALEYLCHRAAVFPQAEHCVGARSLGLSKLCCSQELFST